jgi:hypothetical protein
LHTSPVGDMKKEHLGRHRLFKALGQNVDGWLGLMLCR